MNKENLASKLESEKRKCLRVDNGLYVPAGLLWVGDQASDNLTFPFNKFTKKVSLDKCIIGEMLQFPIDPQLHTFNYYNSNYRDYNFSSCWYYCDITFERLYKIPKFRDYIKNNLLFIFVDNVLLCIPNGKFENSYLFKVYSKKREKWNKDNFSLILCDKKDAANFLQSRDKVYILQGILFRDFFIDQKSKSVEDKEFYCSALDLDTIINNENEFRNSIDNARIASVKVKLSKHGFIYLCFSENISYCGLDGINLILEHLCRVDNEKVFKEYRKFIFNKYNNKIPKYISLNSCIFAINYNDYLNLIKKNKLNKFKHMAAK